MSDDAPRGGGSGAARRLEEAIELIEMELRHAIDYINDAVVPEIRRESITAMRRVAQTLHNLADRMEKPSERPHHRTEGPQS